MQNLGMDTTTKRGARSHRIPIFFLAISTVLLVFLHYNFLIVPRRGSITSETLDTSTTPSKGLTSETLDTSTSTPSTGQNTSFYLVTVEELEITLPAITGCGWEIYGAMSYERWTHHPDRTLDKTQARLVVFPPFLTDELNWPVYGGGNWNNNFARKGQNPGSRGDKAGECSIAFALYVRTEYKFEPEQKYLLHFGSCGWDKGYALPRETYQDPRGIIAKGNALYEHHRQGFDISVPPPFTDNVMRMRYVPSSTKINRSIFVAFKGTMDTHPLRAQVQRLHNPEKNIVIVGNGNNAYDYWKLLSEATYALVIRGHVSFSYRFSEVVCSGAIPVLLSDDWVPPFDDLVPFHEYGIRVPEAQVHDMIKILSESDRIEERQKRAASFCQEYLITPWHQFDTLMRIALSRVEEKTSD